jgi:hypothetical protein
MGSSFLLYCHGLWDVYRIVTSHQLHMLPLEVGINIARTVFPRLIPFTTQTIFGKPDGSVGIATACGLE